MAYNRYDNASDIVFRGVQTKGMLGSYPWLDVKPDDNDIATFKVPADMEGSPRRIATLVYNNHSLHWVITQFNYKWYNDLGAMDVFNWPSAGKLIYYPRPHVIMPYLL